MNHPGVQLLLPGFLRRYVLHFETLIQARLSTFASGIAPGAMVLDAGAGEGQHRPLFARQRYVALDLAVGDPKWNYRGLDAVGDLTALPLRDACFDACINIVTLEHVRDPARALQEMFRVLKPGGRLLLIVPHEWEVHQSPHDYFRYTRHGLTYLLEQAGFEDYTVEPAGGYFRLLGRRLLNGLQFFPAPLMPFAAFFLAPPALLLPLFDGLDRERNFTLGYVSVAYKPLR